MEHLTTLLLTYKYVILLPLAVIEGPLVIVTASFLASQGLFDLSFVYVIGVLGNLIGDTIYYSIGRLGRHTFIRKYGKYIGVTDERIKRAEEHYKNHLLKTIFFSKVINTGIEIFLVTAGVAKVDFRKFIAIITAIEIPKTLLSVLIGFYWGASYTVIYGYFHNIVLAILAVLAIGVVLYGIRQHIKKVSLISP